MTRLRLADHYTPVAALSVSDERAAVDLAPFVRVGLGVQALGGAPLGASLDRWVHEQLGQPTDPRHVPLAALRAMQFHPTVYLAERTIGGIVRRPDLYFVRHKDRRVVRETEEWLWPLLPDLLAACARAFSYGSVPIVLDWTVEDLRIEVARDDGSVRQKTLPAHVHYGRAHELWPGDVELLLDNDDLLALQYGGRRYLADRAHVLRWDAEFGSWLGQGARRRAWRDFCYSLATEGLQRLYLERSVDSPRVVYAPPGTAAEETSVEHLSHLVIALKGSGVLGLPSVRDAAGNRKYEIDTLEIPDRKDVWQQALNRFDAGILKAYLVPPSLAGVEDLAATGAKILDGMLREFIQDFAIFAASNLTHLVRLVHARNHDPRKVPPPEVLAFEVPSAVRKLYLEVLRIVSAANHGQAPSDWVDVPALLDQLGVPMRTAPLPASERAGGQPGRPRDITSEREQRREDARTVDGEDAVGGRDEEAA